MAGHRDPNIQGTVVVAGGMNTDVVDRSFAPLLACDSNPGWTSVSSGGVGRNVAENFVHAGGDAELVAAERGDRNALALSTASRQYNVSGC